MAWETRARGGRYYTRHFRRNGHRIRQYIGRGEHAEALAAQDARTRERRERARSQRSVYQAADEALTCYVRAVDAQVREMLQAVGYHQHARGEWRLRRDSGRTSA